MVVVWLGTALCLVVAVVMVVAVAVAVVGLVWVTVVGSVWARIRLVKRVERLLRRGGLVWGSERDFRVSVTVRQRVFWYEARYWLDVYRLCVVRSACVLCMCVCVVCLCAATYC